MRFVLSLLAIALPLAVSTQAQEQAVVPKVHVLLVADAKHPAMGAYWKAARDNLKHVLEEGFATRPHRLELTVLEDPMELLSHYQKLKGKVKAEDTLFAYCTGLGAGTAQQPVLFPTHAEPIAINELRLAMKDVEARQVVIVTDLWQVPEPKLKTVTTAALGDDLFSLPAKAEWPVLDSLLFHHRGLTEIHTLQDDPRWLLADAKDKPQASMATAAFITLICRKIGAFQTGLVTWPEFTGDLKKETERLYQARRKSLLAKDPLGSYPESSEPWFQFRLLSGTAPQKIVEKTWLFGAEFADARQGEQHIVVLLKVYPKTPAAEAGLQNNDIILAVEGRPIKVTEDLVRAIEYSEGRIAVTYRRGGENRTQHVQLRPVKQTPK